MSKSKNKQIFERIAVIGIGLIGSSVARVIKKNGLVDFISVSARSEKSLHTALNLGFADSATMDLAESVTNADIVMICTPVSTYKSIMNKIASHLKPGAI